MYFECLIIDAKLMYNGTSGGDVTTGDITLVKNSFFLLISYL